MADLSFMGQCPTTAIDNHKLAIQGFCCPWLLVNLVDLVWVFPVSCCCKGHEYLNPCCYGFLLCFYLSIWTICYFVQEAVDWHPFYTQRSVISISIHLMASNLLITTTNVCHLLLTIMLHIVTTNDDCISTTIVSDHPCTSTHWICHNLTTSYSDDGPPL